MSGRIVALFLLALALLRTMLRLSLGRRRGLREFEADYAADRCVRITSEERASMVGFGRCIVCGLCDQGEGERMIQSGGLYTGVMAFVVGASRTPGDPAAASAIAGLSDELLAEKERLCPTAVPIRALARLVRQKAGEPAYFAGLPAAEHPSLSPPIERGKVSVHGL